MSTSGGTDAGGGLTLVIAISLNEKLVIDEVMQGLLDLGDPSIHVLLVDDDSIDQTWRNYGTNWAAPHANFHLLRRPTRVKGQGNAWRAGFEWCFEAENHYDYVVTMAANTTDDPVHVPAILEKLKAGADVVVAERSAEPGADASAPRKTWGFAGTAIGAPISDVESHYRGYTRAALETIDPLSTKATDHRLKTELLARAVARKLKIAGLPVPFRALSDKSDKLGGNSSFGWLAKTMLKRVVGKG